MSELTEDEKQTIAFLEKEKEPYEKAIEELKAQGHSETDDCIYNLRKSTEKLRRLMLLSRHDAAMGVSDE